MSSGGKRAGTNGTGVDETDGGADESAGGIFSTGIEGVGDESTKGGVGEVKAFETGLGNGGEVVVKEISGVGVGTSDADGGISGTGGTTSGTDGGTWGESCGGVGGAVETSGAVDVTETVTSVGEDKDTGGAAGAEAGAGNGGNKASVGVDVDRDGRAAVDGGDVAEEGGETVDSIEGIGDAGGKW